MSRSIFYSALLDAAPDGVVVVNQRGEIVLVNARTESLFGYSRKELLGRRIEILMPERFRNGHTGLRPVGVGLAPYGLRKDDSEFPVEISVSPVEMEEQTLLLAAIRDITERKRGDDALRQSEEHFRVALKCSPVVVFNQDLDLRYTWSNSPVLAWANQEYIGRTDMEVVGGEEGARLTAIKQSVLDSGAGVRTECAVPFMGQTHYFDLNIEPLFDSRGILTGITCACTDVTPLKQVAAERERLIAELQDALAKVKLLSGLLAMCASCKRIRDEQGSWRPLELYIRSHSEADFTHGICPECLQKLYPEYSGQVTA